MMGSLKANHWHTNESLGLGEPFPSSPTRPPKFGIRVQKGVIRNYDTFYSTYAAKRYVDSLINDRKYSWVDDDTIEVDDLRISGGSMTHLEEVMEYEFKGREAEWEIPIPMVYAVQSLLGQVSAPPAPVEKVASEAKADRKRKRRSERKVSSEPVRRRTTDEGMATVASLSQEYGLTPRESRGLLRKAGIEKPDAGWLWQNDDGALDKVRAALSGNSKKNTLT